MTQEIQLTYNDILHFADQNQNSDNAFQTFIEYLNQHESVSQVFIKVTGDNFNCSISGDFAKGLANIQDNFYRFCALALYGSDKINLLKREEKEAFLLHFQIKAGCTEAVSNFLAPLQKLGNKCAKKMSPNQITALLFVAIVSFGTYSGYELYLGHEEKTANIEVCTKAIDALGTSNQMLIEKGFSMRDNNVEELVKNTTAATQIKIGAITLSEHDIATLKQRASREKAVVNTFTKDYKIYQINNKDPNVLKIVVSEIDTNSEYTVSVDCDLFQEPEDKDLLWDYAKNQSIVSMQITESRKKNGATYRLESFESKE